MRLVLHPKVYSDIDEIMGYYERVATPGLVRGVLQCYGPLNAGSGSSRQARSN